MKTLSRLCLMLALTALLAATGCPSSGNDNKGPSSGEKPPEARPVESPEPVRILPARSGDPEPIETPAKRTLDAGKPDTVAPPSSQTALEPRPIDGFLDKGLDWLIAAQGEDGGWGAGAHARQGINDPHAVAADPATTSIVTLALLRSGSTLDSGKHKDALKRAVIHLVGVVEAASTDGPKITDLTGTQPQVKLGAFVDTSLTAQLLARVLPLVKDSSLKERVAAALDKCVKKIESSQGKDGSWTTAGWAPVLQSSIAHNALEQAQTAGRKVDASVLAKSQKYQQGNVQADGRVAAGAGAGVELYAFSGNVRANAQSAYDAQAMMDQAKRDGKLEKEAKLTRENLEKAGATQEQSAGLVLAVKQTEAATARLSDERLLSGFGNNGGEEFLSYMLTSESLVVTGGDKWGQWTDKMHERLSKIQNPDGSWSGHHCITSPVFCTAAVALCLTADRDVALLRAKQQPKGQAN